MNADSSLAIHLLPAASMPGVEPPAALPGTNAVLHKSVLRGGGCLTSAATMSMIRVGSFRLPNHSLKKLLGGMALNLLAPKAALRQRARRRRWRGGSEHEVEGSGQLLSALMHH